MANLVNLCLYQVGWFACVLGAATQRPWLGMGLGLMLLCIHLALVRGVLRHLALIGVAGAIGLAADSVQMWWGVFRYPNWTVDGGRMACAAVGCGAVAAVRDHPAVLLAVAVSTVLAQLARGTGGWTAGVLRRRKVGGHHHSAISPASLRPPSCSLVAGYASPRRRLRSPDRRIWCRWSVPLAIASLAPRRMRWTRV